MRKVISGRNARSAYARALRRAGLGLVVGALAFVGLGPAGTAAAHEHDGVIKGYVYADERTNAYFDVDETPLAGITITLESGGVEVAELQTDEAGQFAFEGLSAGRYRVHEHQPKDYRDGAEVAGIGGVVVGDDVIEVTLAAAGVSSGHLFAEVPAEPGVSNPDYPVAVAGKPLIVEPLANDGVLDEVAGFDPASLRLLDPATGRQMVDLIIPGQARYRVLPGGRVEIVPERGFVGWATEVGYEATTFDGRHSTSTIGVEVRELLPGGGGGRQILPG